MNKLHRDPVVDCLLEAMSELAIEFGKKAKPADIYRVEKVVEIMKDLTKRLTELSPEIPF